jgi:KUP system potassium uptake protein
MTGSPHGTPPALLHNFKHNKVVHERVVLLTVQTADEPHVADAERVTVTPLESGFFRVQARFGFKERAPRHQLLQAAAQPGGRAGHASRAVGRLTRPAKARAWASR